MMDQMENQLNTILGNPELMGKIMQLAQGLQQNGDPPGTSAPIGDAPPEAPAPPPAQEVGAFALPDGLDLQTLGKLSGLLGKTNVDPHQHALLQAMIPYLSKTRIDKLERAMRAAKMASVASSLFGNGFLFGR